MNVNLNVINSRENISNKRFFSLDCIRVIACICIVLYHYTTRFIELYDQNSYWNFSFNTGAAAVDVFFILTGFFSIYYLNSQKIDVSLRRKALRLYPTYWICVSLTFVICYFFLKERSTSFSVFLVNLTMFQSFISIPSVDGAYWTLAYDLIFYTFIAIISSNKILYSKIDIILCLWLIFSIGFSIIFPWNTSFFLFKVLKRVFILDGIYAFAIGAALANMIKNKKTKTTFFMFLLSLIYIVINRLYVNLIYILLFGLLFYLLTKYENLINKNIRYIVTYLSLLTYPFYLLHQNIGYLILKYTLSFNVNEIVIIIPIIIIFFLSCFVQKIVGLFSKSKFVNRKSNYKK